MSRQSALELLYGVAESANVYTKSVKVFLEQLAHGRTVWFHGKVPTTDENMVAYRSSIALAAALHIEYQHRMSVAGVDTTVLTRETFLANCGSMYDVLEYYYSATEYPHTSNEKDIQ